MTTATTQHTPGPLEWQDGRLIETANGEAVLEAGIDDDDATPFIAVTDEDAQLFAAAPELLAALKLVGEWCDLIEQNDPLMRAAFVKQVRAAIAKAEGRS